MLCDRQTTSSTRVQVGRNEQVPFHDSLCNQIRRIFFINSFQPSFDFVSGERRSTRSYLNNNDDRSDFPRRRKTNESLAPQKMLNAIILKQRVSKQMVRIENVFLHSSTPSSTYSVFVRVDIRNRSRKETGRECVRYARKREEVLMMRSVETLYW